MFEYDPSKNLVHHPTPNLKRYGINTFLEPLYRIVATESRRNLVGGCWPDGEVAYHWVKTYKQVTAQWILERWDWCNMTKQKWDELTDPVSGWLVNGPYPARGEYYLAWEFDLGVAQDSLDTIIGAVERGRERSFGEIRAAHQKEYDYEEQDSKKQAEAEIRDVCRYKGNAPMSYGKYGRGSKTEPDLLSAEELGLPLPRLTPRRNPKDLRGLEFSSSLSTRV